MDTKELFDQINKNKTKYCLHCLTEYEYDIPECPVCKGTERVKPSKFLLPVFIMPTKRLTDN